MWCGEKHTRKKWSTAVVSPLVLDETNGCICECGRGEGGKPVPFVIRVFSIRLMIVDHEPGMAPHSAEKDLCPFIKRALIGSLTIVPFAGKKSFPPRVA